MAGFFKWLLAVAALVGATSGAAFGAGRAYESRQATPISATPVGASGAPARSQLALNTSGPMPGMGRPTAGTVSKIDGQTLTVTTLDNQTVTVTVPADAPITRQATVALGDVAVGQRVSVVPQGTPTTSGAIVAQSVAVMPDGPSGGRAGNQGGQGGGAQGGQGAGGQGRGPGGNVQPTPTPSSR